LVVNDLRRAAAERHIAAGAEWADTPRQVAEAVEVVFTSLPAPPDVDAVALGDNGVIAGLRRGGALFDLSTNAVPGVRALHAQFAERGLHFLDAPVSGGPSGAASGRLAIWVGGEESVFDRCKPLLDAMGDQARYIGPIGAGSVAKLVHNCTSAMLNCALAEVFTMGIKAGVDPQLLWEAVRQGATGRKRTFDRLAEHFLTGQYDPPGFAFRLLHKDVSLAVALGREVNVPMRMANLVLQELTEALNRGWGQRDSSVAMLLQQERAGIAPLEIDPERLGAVLEGDGAK
jgi:3-hydroxyisobutyrate dehydrogenase